MQLVFFSHTSNLAVLFVRFFLHLFVRPCSHKEFSGVELQYDESIRAGSLAQSPGQSGFDATGAFTTGGTQFEEVQDEPLYASSHRASIV